MRRMWNKFIDFLALVLEVIKEVWFVVIYTIKSNLYVMGKMLEFSIPYIMWYLTISLYEERGQFAVGGEMFLPVLLFFICGVIRKASNKKGQGNEFPVANKRFTTEEEYGEVTISEDDIQEIILYLNDVENYIEKRGMQRRKS